MSVKDGSHKDFGIFFITFTCYKWLPLFEITQSYASVYKWFDYLISKEHKVFSYVIMPNHLHLLIGKRRDSTKISTIISNGKRFMAYYIVAALKDTNQIDILNCLQLEVLPSDKKRGKLHQVFEASFDCKECYNKEFAWQKINYIHQNPIKGKWRLGKDSIDYPHSSALFYEDVSKVSEFLTYIGWAEDNNLFD